MTDAEAVAQAQLDILLKLLEMIGNFLRRIDHALPLSPQEMSREDSEGGESDITSEVRRAIQCGLADHIDPFIVELRAASTYRPLAAGPEKARRARRAGKKKKDDRPRKRKA